MSFPLQDHTHRLGRTLNGFGRGVFFAFDYAANRNLDFGQGHKILRLRLVSGPGQKIGLSHDECNCTAF